MERLTTRRINLERQRYPNRDIANSLIVLPEAFNIGPDYNPPAISSALPGGKVLRSLQRRKSLLARLNECDGYRIVCVPARFGATVADPQDSSRTFLPTGMFWQMVSIPVPVSSPMLATTPP